MTKQERYQRYFMKVAKLTAENSFAKRAKVGAILVNNGRLVASGWNGQPTGFDNACEKEVVNPDGSKTLVTLPTVIHAESNLISFCAKHGIITDGTELYLTLSPCVNCALLIMQAGIKTVYYCDRYHDTSGLELLEKSNVAVHQLKV